MKWGCGKVGHFAKAAVQSQSTNEMARRLYTRPSIKEARGIIGIGSYLVR